MYAPGKNFHEWHNKGSKSRHRDDPTHNHLEKFAQGQKNEGGVESIPEGGGCSSAPGGVLISATRGGCFPLHHPPCAPVAFFK